MADLILKGSLNLSGTLRLAGAGGGHVKVGDDDVLVTPGAEGTGVPVIQPPPPSTPADAGTKVTIQKSFNESVTAGGKAVVAQGITIQGNSSTWPGMMLPSTKNATVQINGIAINVKGDQGITLPNGGTATFNTSGQ